MTEVPKAQAGEAVHIARIDLTNFKAHAQLTVENPGTFMLATGKNESGKTSFIDSIKVLVEGGGAECIKLGEKSAVIKMQLGDKIEATRKIDGNGKGKLKVVHDDQYTVNAPAKFLADMLGASNFRPIAFFDMDGAARKAAVLETVNVECTDDDWQAWGIAEDMLEVVHEVGEKLHPLELVKAIEQTIYKDRAVANKAAKEAAADAAAAKPTDTVTPKRRKQTVDAIATAQAEVNAAEAKMDARAEKAAQRARTQIDMEQSRTDAIDMERQIVNHESEIKRLREGIVRCTAEADRLATILTAADAAEPAFDMAALRDRLNSLFADDYQQKEMLLAELKWQEKADAAKAVQAEADALNTALATLREKAMPTLLERANMPIEGLSIGETDVLYKGVEASELSGAQRLHLALQVAKSAAGNAGVICLDGLEQLDADTFAKLLEDTRNDGYQYFATRVTDDDLEINDMHAKGDLF